MAGKRDSLFSLELVVEKLYIPHSDCRFPAVAFRLLDFPTILIEHVEQDLAEKIRHKIKVDPYYNVPYQFHELKDKDGNFLIKKGKSCLFRISMDTLKMHLSNTPLYVMIIDNFPDTPKLLGNATIPLNEVMESILIDIRKLGENVPSVHGDKGLYKIYSLMGKDIGYIIMAYRLLSLGPGLIPHIPETAIAKRISEKEIVADKEVKETMAEVKIQRFQEAALNNTQEMGSMTEPEKCDVMLQTIEMCDKQIQLAVSAPENEKQNKDTRVYNTAGTQTDKKKKQKLITVKSNLKVELEGSDEDDGIIITDIAQPPPLFFNSEAEPTVKIHESYSYSDDGSSENEDDLSEENLSEKDLIVEKEMEVRKAGEHFYEQYRKQPNYNDQQKLSYHRQEYAPKRPHVAWNQNINVFKGFTDMATNAPNFPLLNALMNELSRIQNQGPEVPHMQDQVQREQQPPVQQVVTAQAASRQAKVDKVERNVPKTFVKPKSSKPSSRTFRGVEIQENIDIGDQESLSQSNIKHQSRKSHKGCAHPHGGVPKQRSWMRKVPELGVKKSKLSFGLTNTQRLRLSKVNPDWLKVIEKEEQEAKALRKKPERKIDDQEFESGNLSDTFTEVRRLAAKNLEETQGNETLNQTDENLQSLPLSEVSSPVRKNVRRVSPPRRRVKSPARRSRQSPVRKRSRSPKHKKIIPEEVKRHSDITEEESLTKSTVSPKVPPQVDNELDEDHSARSQKSLEVRIPSAQMEDDEESDFTLSESDVPDDSPPNRNIKFPGFLDHNASIPDSINGKANLSRNVSKDFGNDENEDFEPLESTRNSKRNEESQFNHSGEDYDTRQFHSTDEPELQRLMSSGEKSEVSDVLSGHSDRSVESPVPPSSSWVSSKFQVINPKASIQSPIPAVRRSQVKLGSSAGRPTPTDSPRSSKGGSRYPTPRTSIRKNAREKRIEFKHDSIHTESVSSYAPSEASISLASDGAYSDDFHAGGTDEETSGRLSSPDVNLPKFLPSTKLGYTIS